MSSTKRRFEYIKGSSNKFYEITIASPRDTERWTVTTSWGRIGRVPTSRTQQFGSKTNATYYSSERAREKIKKGYQEITLPPTKPIIKVPSVEKIKLPTVWPSLRGDLLPGEVAIYEKYNDKRTKQRRIAIATKYKTLVLKDLPEETQSIRKAAWLYLRYAYLKYLLSMSLYKPAMQEGVASTVTALKEKLKNLSDKEKAFIDAGLKKFSKRKGKLSLSECEAGINYFVDSMICEIEEKQTAALGGVSRKRVRVLARRKKNKQDKS